jgi:hypothetical protein
VDRTPHILMANQSFLELDILQLRKVILSMSMTLAVALILIRWVYHRFQTLVGVTNGQYEEVVHLLQIQVPLVTILQALIIMFMSKRQVLTHLIRDRSPLNLWCQRGYPRCRFGIACMAPQWEL